MPTRDLSFEGQQSGWDELGGANAAFVNCLVNQPSGARSRPGIRDWADWPASVPSVSPVVAMAPFQDALIYITDDGAGTRDLFMWRNGVVLQLSTDAASRIDGSQRPNIATTRSWAIVVGGGAPQKITTGFVSSRLGGTPPAATDISTITQYLVLVANDLSGQFFWDTPGDGGIESWDQSLDFREAEARPDALVACRDTSRELWMFGTQTTQVYLPDPDQTFAPGPTIDYGCIARQSPIKQGDAMAWLADGRRFFWSDRRAAPDDLGDKGMGADFKLLKQVADCWGFRCVMGNFDLLVWVFPTEGRTFAYESKKGVWSEWRGWRNGRWQPWIPQSYAYWEEKNVHLVGLADGSIAELSLEATDDAGDEIRCISRLGFSTPPGDEDTVQARDLRLVLRSLPISGASVADGTIDVRWRDNLGPFKAPVRKTFSTAQPTVLISPVGIPYQQRQYEFAWNASDAVYLAGATEVLEQVET